VLERKGGQKRKAHDDAEDTMASGT
jgi:hypothetical protein